jgi:hypothetical protein
VFFGTFRRLSANNYLGNTFTSTGSQAVDDQHLTDATIRLTYQASRNNKLSFHYDRSIKWRGHRPNNWLTASLNDPISDVVQTTQLNYIGEIKWSSPISNRVLAEAAVFTLPVNYTLGFEPDAAPGVCDLRSDPLGDQRRLAAHGHQQRTHVHLPATLACHRVVQPESRTQVRTGWSQELFTIRGDILQINNGVPNSAAGQHAERP